MTLEELEVIISANTRQFNRQIAQVQNQVNSMANRVNNSVNGMANRVNSSVNSMSGKFNQIGKTIGKVFTIVALAKFTKGCIDLGSNLTEVQNVVDVTFGNMSEKVNEFAKNAWKTIGLSQTMAKQYMGNYGAMSKSMGFATEEAEKMAETLTNLTGDVASFYNIRQDAAYVKLKSVFTGETETLKELGVVMTQENLNQYALANGYGKTIDKMTQQEKVALRLAYVTQTLSAANGDFARTQNTWANQVRLLSLQFSSLRANIGQGLIAVLTPVINVINILMSKLVALSATFNSVLNALGLSTGNSTNATGITDTTDAMNNLGNATDNVGKKASSSKKKLEALMSFDEINKINNNDSGSGAGGGGTAGGINAAKIENPLNALNDKVNKILGELLSPLKKAWDNYGEWFLSKWDYFKKAFGYSCDELKKFLNSVWNHGGKEFVQHMAEIGIAIGGVALQIGGDILVALGNLWKHLNPDNNPYTRKFIAVMNELAIAVRDFIISAGNWFGKFLDLGGQAFINVIGDIVILVGTILAEVIRDAVKFVTDFMNSWAGSVIIGAVALTLDIVAGAIKAVIVVLEKCHKALEVLLVLWGAWKFSSIITGVTDTTTRLGALVYKLYGLRINIADNISSFKNWTTQLAINCINAIKKFGSALASPIETLRRFKDSIKTSLSNLKDWILSVKTNAVNAMRSFSNSIKTNLVHLKNWIIETGTKAIKSTVKFIAKIGASIASLLGLTTAEGVATAGATALNVALGALGIGVIIAAVTGLFVAVKKIGDKFGWWTSLSNALSSVLGWVGEKVGWLWDKIKGFFGWDTEPEVKENLEEIGDTAEDNAQKIESAFGTASSNANKFLNSINFDSGKLAEQFEEAKKSADEKFSLLSQNAQDYLDAVVSNNKDRLAEMGDNQQAYCDEVKQMYADLTEDEKVQFLAQYGVVKGVNDDILNYEGLTYDERVARHTAFIQSLSNNTNMSYQEKKRLIDEDQQNFEQSVENEKAKYEELIQSKQKELDEYVKAHGDSSEQDRQIEEQLMNEIEEYKKHITDITKSNDDEQSMSAEQKAEKIKNATQESCDEVANSTQSMEDSVNASYEHIQTSSYTNMMQSAENMKHILDSADEVIQGISNVENSLNASYEHIQTSSYTNMTKAGSNMNNALKGIVDTVNTVITSMRGMEKDINSAMEHINQTMYYNAAKASESMVNQLDKGTNTGTNLVSTMESKINKSFEHIENSSYWNMYNTGKHIREYISNAVEKAINEVNRLQRTINNFNATLKVKIPHFSMDGNFNAETGEVPKVRVNYFAKGGIVDRATLGVFGEAGREALVPLQHNTEWMDTLEGIMNNAFTQALQINTTSNNEDGNLTLIIDGDVIGKVALKEFRRMQRQGGITLIPT